MNKNYTPLALLALVVLAIITGVVLARLSLNPTALVSHEPKLEMDLDSIDHVAIDKSELKLCCEFVKEGVRKGCWVLAKYDCGYCDDSCG